MRLEIFQAAGKEKFLSRINPVDRVKIIEENFGTSSRDGIIQSNNLRSLCFVNHVLKIKEPDYHPWISVTRLSVLLIIKQVLGFRSLVFGFRHEHRSPNTEHLSQDPWLCASQSLGICLCRLPNELKR